MRGTYDDGGRSDGGGDAKSQALAALRTNLISTLLLQGAAK